MSFLVLLEVCGLFSAQVCFANYVLIRLSNNYEYIDKTPGVIKDQRLQSKEYIANEYSGR